MTNILTSTEVQQRIGQISDQISTISIIVTNRGKPKIVMLPYFPGCDDLIDEYEEDYEIWLNREQLKKEMKESSESGISNFKI
jgi:hypothetical protein